MFQDMCGIQVLPETGCRCQNGLVTVAVTTPCGSRGRVARAGRIASGRISACFKISAVLQSCCKPDAAAESAWYPSPLRLRVVAEAVSLALGASPPGGSVHVSRYVRYSSPS